MPLPVNTSHYYADGPMVLPVFSADQKMIGLVSNRGYSCQFKRVLSLANLDINYTKEGTEVFVLYGQEGKRQTMVRATVAQTPYKKDNRQ